MNTVEEFGIRFVGYNLLGSVLRDVANSLRGLTGTTGTEALKWQRYHAEAALGIRMAQNDIANSMQRTAQWAEYEDQMVQYHSQRIAQAYSSRAANGRFLSDATREQNINMAMADATATESFITNGRKREETYRSNRESEIQTTQVAVAQAKVRQVAEEEALVRQERLVKGYQTVGMMASVAGLVTVAGAGGMAYGLDQAAQKSANLTHELILNRTQAFATSQVEGEAVQQLDAYRNAVIGLSNEFGTSAEEGAKALYLINSVAGLTVSGVEVLHAAEMGAVVGQSDLVQTSSALASAMAVYGKSMQDPVKMMGMLDAITGTGKMTMDDLLSALKNGLAPVAQSAGISLQSLGGALASLTDMGIPASRSAIYLRSALIQMTMPTGPATEALKALGLTEEEVGDSTSGFSQLLADAGINQSQLADKLRSTGSLTDTLQFLTDRLKAVGANSKETDALLARMFGGIRSGTGMVSLTENLDRLRLKETEVGQGADRITGSFEFMQQHDPAYWFSVLKESITNTGLTIGAAVMPQFMALAKEFIPLIQGAQDWINHNKELVGHLAFLAIAVLGITGFIFMLVGGLAFLGAAIAGISAGAGAIGLIVGIFGGLSAVVLVGIGLVVMFRNEWGIVWNFIQTSVLPIFRTWGDVLGTLWKVFQTFTTDIWPKLDQTFSLMFKDLFDQQGAAGSAAGAYEDFGKRILGVVKSEGFAKFVAYLEIGVPEAASQAAAAIVLFSDILGLVVKDIATDVKLIVDVMTHDWKSAWEDGKNAVKTNSDSIDKIMKDSADFQKLTSSQAATETQANYERAWRNIYDSANDISVQVPDKFDQMAGKVAERAADMEDKTAAHAQALHQKVQDQFEQLADKVVGHSIVPDMVDSTIAEFDRLNQSVVTKATDLNAQVYSAFTAVGQSMVDGIAYGAQTQQGHLNAVMDGIVYNAVQSAKSSAQISSPSQLTAAQIGVPLGQGVAVGLESTVPMVGAIMTGMIAKIGQPFMGGMTAQIGQPFMGGMVPQIGQPFMGGMVPQIGAGITPPGSSAISPSSLPSFAPDSSFGSSSPSVDVSGLQEALKSLLTELESFHKDNTQEHGSLQQAEMDAARVIANSGESATTSFQRNLLSGLRTN